MVKLPYWLAWEVMNKFEELLPEEFHFVGESSRTFDDGEWVDMFLHFSFCEEEEEDSTALELCIVSGQDDEAFGCICYFPRQPYRKHAACGWLVGPAEMTA